MSAGGVGIHAVPRDGGDAWRDTPAQGAAPYAALIGLFAALFAFGARARASRETAPIAVADVACIGLASHDIARIVARDRITTFLRAPFAAGEAAQYPRGRGLRRAVGELITCPHCLSIWAAVGLTSARVRYPRAASFASAAFAAHAVAGAYESIVRRRFWC